MESERAGIGEEELHAQSRRELIAPAQAMVCKYADPGLSLADELIAERRVEAMREEEGWGTLSHS
jgi:hypothetical protein